MSLEITLLKVLPHRPGFYEWWQQATLEADTISGLNCVYASLSQTQIKPSFNYNMPSVVRSAGTSGGPSRKKKHRLPARSNAASSLEESRQYWKVSTYGSSGLRTISGLCRGRKILQVVPRRVLRTHFFYLLSIFLWGHFVFVVFWSNFSYFFFRGVAWPRDAIFVFCRPFSYQFIYFSLGPRVYLLSFPFNLVSRLWSGFLSFSTFFFGRISWLSDWLVLGLVYLACVRGLRKRNASFTIFVIGCFVLVWEYFGNFGVSELCYVGLRVYTVSELFFSIFGGCICIYLLWWIQFLSFLRLHS